MEIVAKVELPSVDGTGTVASFIEEAQAQLDNLHPVDVPLEDSVLVLGLSVEHAEGRPRTPGNSVSSAT